MSKKIMLLGLAVVAAAMFALPATGSAAELHWSNLTTFTGTAGAGTLSTGGEPTISCTSGHVHGEPSAGGTTGEVTFDFTGCTDSIFHAACHTAGSALNNTIESKGTYHLVTLASSNPGMLVTTEKTTITCAGFFTTTVQGNLLGTITSPACGGSSKEMKTSFAATGSTQNHLEYTGVKYDLTSTTSGGSANTAGLTASGTISQTTAGTLTCT
jgi:hypothetical protein